MGRAMFDQTSNPVYQSPYSLSGARGHPALGHVKWVMPRFFVSLCMGTFCYYYVLLFIPLVLSMFFLKSGPGPTPILCTMGNGVVFLAFFLSLHRYITKEGLCRKMVHVKVAALGMYKHLNCLLSVTFWVLSVQVEVNINSSEVAGRGLAVLPAHLFEGWVQ